MSKLLIVLQMNEPPFSPGEQFSVDYGLRETPAWVSAMVVDLSMLEDLSVVEDWEWALQFWSFNVALFVLGALFVGCEYGTKSMTATRIRVQFVALMIIPLVRTNASFWFECTGFVGTNEMRWQMAGANASDANTTDDQSFFEITEEELYGTSVSTNFYDQDPAESCRESKMLTYGLVAVLFCMCQCLAIGYGVFTEATQQGDYKPKPPYEHLYTIIKVRPLSLGNTVLVLTRKCLQI
eukprot:COSAG04_NODE_10028_length_812_cov_0.802244_1_plen_237_part_01